MIFPKNIKKPIIGLTSFLLLSSLLVSTANADNKSKYPYEEHISGISKFKDDENLQTCLKWASWVPDSYSKKPETLRHALYDIGRMGDAMVNYGNDIRKGRNQNKVDEESRKLILRGQRALEFCSYMPPVPKQFQK